MKSKLTQMNAAEIQTLRQKTLEKVEASPRKAAKILTDWIKNPSKSKKIKKNAA